MPHASGQRRTPLNDVASIGQGAGCMNSVNIAKKTSDCPPSEQTMRACSVNFGGSLESKCFGSSTYGSTRGNHVINDRHTLPIDVQILGFVDNGVRVDTGFFEIGEFATD